MKIFAIALSVLSLLISSAAQARHASHLDERLRSSRSIAQASPETVMLVMDLGKDRKFPDPKASAEGSVLIDSRTGDLYVNEMSFDAREMVPAWARRRNLHGDNGEESSGVNGRAVIAVDKYPGDDDYQDGQLVIIIKKAGKPDEDTGKLLQKRNGRWVVRGQL